MRHKKNLFSETVIYLLLLYLTLCYPLLEFDTWLLFELLAFVVAVPPGLAGRFVGALEGRPATWAVALLAEPVLVGRVDAAVVCLIGLCTALEV